MFHCTREASQTTTCMPSVHCQDEGGEEEEKEEEKEEE